VLAVPGRFRSRLTGVALGLTTGTSGTSTAASALGAAGFTSVGAVDRTTAFSAAGCRWESESSRRAATGSVGAAEAGVETTGADAVVETSDAGVSSDSGESADSASPCTRREIADASKPEDGFRAGEERRPVARPDRGATDRMTGAAGVGSGAAVSGFAGIKSAGGLSKSRRLLILRPSGSLDQPRL
jgi:hypothetical protein